MKFGCLALVVLGACTASSFELEEFGSLRASIVNGTRTPQNTTLSDGEILAIGYLADSTGDDFCTGTLIADRYVITAQHCTDEYRASDIFFGIGTLPTDPVALLDVAAIYEHPSIDFAMLELLSDASDEAPDIEPITINREPLSDSWVGRWVDASGFGLTYSDDIGRFFASVQIFDYDAEIVSVDGHGEQGICYGDSGGPILWQPDATTAPVIVGTEQTGDASCVDHDYLTRVDVVASFVDAVMAGEITPVVDGCGEIDYLGHCVGNVVEWCDGRELSQINCGAQGKVCAWEDEETGYWCSEERYQTEDPEPAPSPTSGKKKRDSGCNAGEGSIFAAVVGLLARRPRGVRA